MVTALILQLIQSIVKLPDDSDVLSPDPGMQVCLLLTELAISENLVVPASESPSEDQGVILDEYKVKPRVLLLVGTVKNICPIKFHEKNPY